VSSNLTHQTSPRFIGGVSERPFGPLEHLRLARFLQGHLLAGDLQVLADQVGPNKGLNELADAPLADDIVQPGLDPLFDRDRQVLLHRHLPQHM
jgi:hypothetical protein